VPDTEIERHALDILEYFLDLTDAPVAMSKCDLQSPLTDVICILRHPTIAYGLTTSIRDSMNRSMHRTADLLIDFSRAQIRLICYALAKPGHGFSSSHTFHCLSMSDDTITMLSPDLYIDMTIATML
jgi:hypothetical protein